MEPSPTARSRSRPTERSCKTFHARDGAGIKLLPGIGITPAIISGRASEATARRARELGIEHVHQGVSDKAGCLRTLCGRLGLDAGQAAFVGDDLSDIPAMRIAGWSAAPADAAAGDARRGRRSWPHSAADTAPCARPSRHCSSKPASGSACSTDSPPRDKAREALA